ncbi:uncharacterized protein KY384_008107 [Bacidia gigantensis]|uniref:uncharacterized protein n=1 Tax=Bacidia gigantensis TaxID=2732470 RepID=UPI001D03E8A0|nr:uncharacterized protein KY384_008107 [Bacidia gigantensis]KAG8526678.1 hypothetical protein KY384_008107 [Bacidia gigantensis]
MLFVISLIQTYLFQIAHTSLITTGLNHTAISRYSIPTNKQPNCEAFRPGPDTHTVPVTESDCKDAINTIALDFPGPDPIAFYTAGRTPREWRQAMVPYDKTMGTCGIVIDLVDEAPIKLIRPVDLVSALEGVQNACVVNVTASMGGGTFQDDDGGSTVFVGLFPSSSYSSLTTS